MEEEAEVTSWIECNAAYRKSYQEVRDLQRQHRELRETHLEQLAEAIILDHSPELGYDSMEAVR
jgi:hypothetical protein